MQIQNNGYKTNFGAKIIVGDEKVHKFIKSSFIAKKREMHDLLDMYNNANTDAIVTLNVKNIAGRDVMSAHNGVTGQSDFIHLGNAEVINTENRNAFFDIIMKTLKNKDFWKKNTNISSDMTNLETNIEHDVFKLEG